MIIIIIIKNNNNKNMKIKYMKFYTKAEIPL